MRVCTATKWHHKMMQFDDLVFSAFPRPTYISHCTPNDDDNDDDDNDDDDDDGDDSSLCFYGCRAQLRAHAHGAPRSIPRRCRCFCSTTPESGCC